MIARDSICRCAHPWSRLISKRSTWNRSKMTTGSGSFEGSSERKISPEALVKSEIAAGNKQPTSSQVADAISALSRSSGEILRSDDPSKLPLPVVIRTQDFSRGIGQVRDRV